MEKLKLLRRLLRMEQWYKNLIVFAPLLFAPNALTFPWALLASAGFCSISAITYIANDWLDREKDRLHPTKKNRPLASGKVSGLEALLTAAVLLVVTLVCLYLLGGFYATVISTYFVLTTLYSFGLKNIPILDLLLIITNFLLRMMAGFSIFPELHQLVYFAALFGLILIFLTHKRRSDIKILGARAAEHKPVLRFYSQPVLYGLRGLAYVFLVFTAEQLFLKGWSLIELGALLGLIFYTSFLFTRYPELTIKPHALVKDKRWGFAAILCACLLLLV